MTAPHKSPGAGSEPTVVHPRLRDVHCMEITRKRVGWYFWAICSCGWADCRADKREVEIEARLHSLKAGAA